VQDLGSTPVIVGVETQQQLDIAIGSGATILQGNFLAAPVVAKVLNDQQQSRISKVA